MMLDSKLTPADLGLDEEHRLIVGPKLTPAEVVEENTFLLRYFFWFFRNLFFIDLDSEKK